MTQCHTFSSVNYWKETSEMSWSQKTQADEMVLLELVIWWERAGEVLECSSLFRMQLRWKSGSGVFMALAALCIDDFHNGKEWAFYWIKYIFECFASHSKLKRCPKRLCCSVVLSHRGKAHFPLWITTLPVILENLPVYCSVRLPSGHCAILLVTAQHP